jgi:hypothetical protein
MKNNYILKLIISFPKTQLIVTLCDPMIMLDKKQSNFEIVHFFPETWLIMTLFDPKTMLNQK